MEPDDERRIAAISAAASRLRVDFVGAEAMRALETEGIPCILLKGASVSRWLYQPEDAQLYVDCDLLVRSDLFGSAVRILESRGFRPELEESDMPSWWREHALTLLRAEDRAMIDMHRNIPGVGVTDEQLWRTLESNTTTMEIGDLVVTVLSEPARAVHTALHVAQHAGSTRHLDVLSRAISRIDEQTWRDAADLARALNATAAFQRGLSFLPAGIELSRRLGLNSESEIEVELRAVGAPEALTIARLISTRGLVERVSFVRHKLFPPATFMRKWSPLAGRGGAGLVAAYAWRPLWIIARVPRAVRSWNLARKRR